MNSGPFTIQSYFVYCGPFDALEAQRRHEKLAKATTPEEVKKASRLTIRSIRRCQNEACGVILHRDRNAASNIATNFKQLYQGLPPLKRLSAEEEQMEQLRCSISS